MSGGQAECCGCSAGGWTLAGGQRPRGAGPMSKSKEGGLAGASPQESLAPPRLGKSHSYPRPPPAACVRSQLCASRLRVTAAVCLPAAVPVLVSRTSDLGRPRQWSPTGGLARQQCTRSRGRRPTPRLRSGRQRGLLGPLPAPPGSWWLRGLLCGLVTPISASVSTNVFASFLSHEDVSHRA